MVFSFSVWQFDGSAPTKTVPLRGVYMSVIEKVISKRYSVEGTGRWKKTTEHDSLVLDCEKDIFFWNSKEIIGSPLDWLMRVEGLSREQAFQELRKYDSAFLYVSDDEIKEQTKYDKLVDVFWKSGEQDRSYWHRRLLTDNTVNRFRLGKFRDTYTVPIFDRGALVNIQFRADEPEKKIFLWYRDRGVHLFNSVILDFFTTIYFCEGVTDALFLNQLGLPALSKIPGALSWDVGLFSRFKNVKQIYLIFDNDDAGRRGASRVAKSLGIERCKIFTFSSFGEKCDVIEFFRQGGSKSDLTNLLQTQSKYLYEIGGIT